MKTFTLKLFLLVAVCGWFACNDAKETDAPKATESIVVAKTEKAKAEALKELNYLAKNSFTGLRSIANDDRKL